LLPDFYLQSAYFFEQPKEYDLPSVKPKWTDAKTVFFRELISRLTSASQWEELELEASFKALAEEKAIKAGELLLPFRIMLVGGKFGPHVFDIAALLGKDETIGRIEKALAVFTV
jgi:glutamyl-tRNA synthetase